MSATAPFTVSRATPYSDLPDRLLVDEAAAYTGMAKDTIYRWVREGRLRNVGFGKIIQIPKECLHPSRAPQVTP
ncbi:MAG TPA: helix-turn-helix domain-containing protein [Vicinamibacterales bacterium]|nr:helix-turn-helix domain-containing protein [Vicinamibacterales bacterium]